MIVFINVLLMEKVNGQKKLTRLLRSDKFLIKCQRGSELAMNQLLKSNLKKKTESSS